MRISIWNGSSRLRAANMHEAALLCKAGMVSSSSEVVLHLKLGDARVPITHVKSLFDAYISRRIVPPKTPEWPFIIKPVTHFFIYITLFLILPVLYWKDIEQWYPDGTAWIVLSVIAMIAGVVSRRLFSKQNRAIELKYANLILGLSIGVVIAFYVFAVSTNLGHGIDKNVLESTDRGYYIEMCRNSILVMAGGFSGNALYAYAAFHDAAVNQEPSPTGINIKTSA